MNIKNVPLFFLTIAAVLLSGCESSPTAGSETSPKPEATLQTSLQDLSTSDSKPNLSEQNDATSHQTSENSDTASISATSLNESSASDTLTASAPSDNDSGWALILVNRDSPLPQDYAPKLTELRNFQYVDERIYPDLQKMFDDMREQGMEPLIISSYRSREEQQEIIDEKIDFYLGFGYTSEDAQAQAYREAAPVGCSEHESGLAVDINAEEGDLWTIYDWLARNAWEYGFILRYPEDKEDITGITYEPWHYRYVGRKAAKEIYERGITLEEYLE